MESSAPASRLAALFYEVVAHDPEHDVIALEDQRFRVGYFDCTLAGTRLVAVPRKPVNEIEGWAEIEPLLRAWAAKVEVETSVALVFRDAGAKLNPSSDGSPAARLNQA